MWTSEFRARLLLSFLAGYAWVPGTLKEMAMTCLEARGVANRAKAYRSGRARAGAGGDGG